MVLLFPGQGSQSPGMGRWLYENFEIAKRVFEESSDAININLKKLIFDGSAAELSLTENTQPALLCVSTATQRVLRSEKEIKISALAGHSIGEYAALVAGQALDLSSAARAVRLRGLSMQEAVPVGQGGMMAVLGLEDTDVLTLCKIAVEKSGYGPLSPANFNSPGQVVISGSAKTLQWLTSNYTQDLLPGSTKKAKLIPLQVSAPFHCEMMAPAEDKMRDFLDSIKFSDSLIPICQNYDAQFTQQANLLKENLIRQISAPVRWTESMQSLVEKKMTNCVECGHGSVLKGLAKKIHADLRVHSLSQLEDLKSLLEAT
jgi:[acyl-carrier-protein] S-malonyltransferase